MQVHAKQTKAYKAAGQRGSQRLAARRLPRGGQGSGGATQSKGHANAVIYATLTALQHSPVAGSRYALEAFVACNVQREGWQTGGAVAVVAGNGVSDAHSLACSDPQQEPRPPDPTPALLIARLLWTEGGKQKQQQQQQRIAGNRIAFLSFITRNGKQRNYHLTHSSAMGNAVEEQRGAEKMERQANLSIKNILKFSRFSLLLHVDKIAKWQRDAARRDEMY